MHVYEQARLYTSLGLSVLPVAPPTKGGKAPHVEALKATGYIKRKGSEIKASWVKAQKQLPDLGTLEAWFSNNGVNIGIIGGRVSGGVTFLDFDTLTAYKSWATHHTNIVCKTAVQKTSKGYHVAIRTADNATGTLYYDGEKVGEIRGEGGYVVAEPSIHMSGIQYKWLDHHTLRDNIVVVKSLEDIGLSRTPGDGPARQFERHNVRDSDVERARRALNRIHSWRADDYHAWVNVGMALSELGEAGRQLWHEWSAQSQKYNARDLDQHFDSFKRQQGTVLRLGSLFYWARQDAPTSSRSVWRTL